MLINEIYGKKIINSVTAEYAGILSGAVVTRDLKEIAAFKISILEQKKDGGRAEKSEYIAPRCIASFKDALVTAELEIIRRPEGNFIDAPLGVPVFNINGILYGYLVDICFNKKFAVTRLVYDRPFSIRNIINISRDVIIAKAAVRRNAKPRPSARAAAKVKQINAGGAAHQPPPPAHTAKINIDNKIDNKADKSFESTAEKMYLQPRLSQPQAERESPPPQFPQAQFPPHTQFPQAQSPPQPQFPQAQLPPPAQLAQWPPHLLSDKYLAVTTEMPSYGNDNISPVYAYMDGLPAPAAPPPPVYYSKYPRKLIGGYTFLLGRTTGEDIRNAKNQIIIPKGAVITHEVVETAAAYNKLVELTFGSVTIK